MSRTGARLKIVAARRVRVTFKPVSNSAIKVVLRNSRTVVGGVCCAVYHHDYSIIGWWHCLDFGNEHRPITGHQVVHFWIILQRAGPSMGWLLPPTTASSTHVSLCMVRIPMEKLALLHNSCSVQLACNRNPEQQLVAKPWLRWRQLSHQYV